MSSEADAELERFRQQWQEEVIRRRDAPPRPAPKARPQHARTASKDASLASHLGGPSRAQDHDNDGHYGTYDFDDMEAHEESRKVGTSGTGVHPESIPNRHPISALDHYEMAVVRETEGKLGESLDLYRKAFRLDDCVDQIYKRKHFPASSFKPKPAEPISTAAVVRNKEPPKASPTISALVASFLDAPILGALPLISRDISPPCPIKDLPDELLVDILDHVANTDIAMLSRLAQVSKRFAYLVTTEESIWKHLVHRPRFGFGGMHYAYNKEISGVPLEFSIADMSLKERSKPAPRLLPFMLPTNTAYPTYRHMFQHRPRIRFSGVYISTVNYTRPGASGPNTLTWNTPIHVVTYYRYLRFYRDGSCISLLTTVEPMDVVPHLQKENVGGDFIATTTLPVGVMRDARRGRWKLAKMLELRAYEHKLSESSSAAVPPDETDADSSFESKVPEDEALDPEGILTIETEGPTKTYHYTARFELRSTGNGLTARNTKLVWRGFWSHNIISGDWAEFGLKNDRAFVWSRVRSWGDA